MGNTSRVTWFEGVGDVRIDRGPEYRNHLAENGETLIILLRDGTKCRQEADIVRARRLHIEYEARETARQKSR